VLGAQGVISNLIDELINLQGTVNNQPDYSKLSGAISNLQQSLAPGSLIDETHLDATNGDMVFNQDVAAVQYLLKLVKDNGGTISGSVLWGYIKGVVKTDRLLASVAVDDARRAGGSLLKLNMALEDVERGDKESARSQFESGIKYYHNAWILATHLTIIHKK
jgi:hypothetical protein